jgi:hypothetical protein
MLLHRQIKAFLCGRRGGNEFRVHMMFFSLLGYRPGANVFPDFDNANETMRNRRKSRMELVVSRSRIAQTQ